MIRLSIIIPFYNVERYIAECLDSVFNQDIPLEEYEVICVNDASPDHSRDIVLDYMKHYPNLHLVEHDHNRKLGAARNTGRAAAKGTYIWNVDSDDKIAPNCLGEMLHLCEDNNLDVLRFDKEIFTNTGEEIHVKRYQWDNVVRNGIEFYKVSVPNQSYFNCVWTLMLRRAYLDEQHIYSPEINMGEDVPFTCQVLLKANRVMGSCNPYYHYRRNDDSLTGRQNKCPKAAAVYEDSVYCTGAIYQSLIHPLAVGDEFVQHFIYNLAQCNFIKDYNFVQQMGVEQRKHLRRLYWKSLRKLHFLPHILSRKQCFRFAMFMLTSKYY